jgi:hypothetical protein
MKKKILIYDCEIAKAIPSSNGFKDRSFQYCRGWDDFKNMGISCIGAWVSWYPSKNRYQIIKPENLENFGYLAEWAEEIIGFNSRNFDDRLLTANGIKISTTYDLLEEIRIKADPPMPKEYDPVLTRSGYGLNQIAITNLGTGKIGSGELAPILYQSGKLEELYKYCLQDVRLTKRLYFMHLKELLKDPFTLMPMDGKKWIRMIYLDLCPQEFEIAKKLGAKRFYRDWLLPENQYDLFLELIKLQEV